MGRVTFATGGLLVAGLIFWALESEGLATAFRALARRIGISVTLLDRGTGRFPHAVESTMYFCALEAVDHVVRTGMIGGGPACFRHLTATSENHRRRP